MTEKITNDGPIDLDQEIAERLNAMPLTDDEKQKMVAWANSDSFSGDMPIYGIRERLTPNDKNLIDAIREAKQQRERDPEVFVSQIKGLWSRSRKKLATWMKTAKVGDEPPDSIKDLGMWLLDQKDSMAFTRALRLKDEIALTDFLRAEIVPGVTNEMVDGYLHDQYQWRLKSQDRDQTYAAYFKGLMERTNRAVENARMESPDFDHYISFLEAAEERDSIGELQSPPLWGEDDSDMKSLIEQVASKGHDADARSEMLFHGMKLTPAYRQNIHTMAKVKTNNFFVYEDALEYVQRRETP